MLSSDDYGRAIEEIQNMTAVAEDETDDVLRAYSQRVRQLLTTHNAEWQALASALVSRRKLTNTDIWHVVLRARGIHLP